MAKVCMLVGGGGHWTKLGTTPLPWMMESNDSSCEIYRVSPTIDGFTLALSQVIRGITALKFDGPKV